MGLTNPEHRNSAGRVLSAVIELRRPYATQRDAIDAAIGDGVEVLADATVTEKIAVLLAEFDNLLDDIRTTPGFPEKQRNLYHDRLRRLRECFIPTALGTEGGNSHRSTYSLRLASEAELSILEICASQLPDEEPVAEDELERIRKSVALLRQEAKDPSTPTALKNVLLELARLSENAIAHYEMHGAKGLKKAFHRMLADIFEVKVQRTQDSPPPSEKEQTIWSTIQSHMRTVDEVAGRLLKYRPLLEHATHVGQQLLG